MLKTWRHSGRQISLCCDPSFWICCFWCPMFAAHTLNAIRLTLSLITSRMNVFPANPVFPQPTNKISHNFYWNMFTFLLTIMTSMISQKTVVHGLWSSPNDLPKSKSDRPLQTHTFIYIYIYNYIYIIIYMYVCI